MAKKSQPKIALVHDYFFEFGGAERVMEELHSMYPKAPVYTAFFDKKSLAKDWQRFKNWDLRETWMARLPFIHQLFSPFRVFAFAAFRDLDLAAYDVVITSTNAYFAKAVKVPQGKQLCYCHTPPRVLYGYTTKSNWRGNPITRVFGQILNHFTRPLDFEAAQNVDVFVANSQETARRIKKFYHRDSEVIFPPVVAVDRAEKYLQKLSTQARKDYQEQKQNGYYLYVNRLVLAKHPEIAVQVAAELQLPLKVVGSGPMLAGLKALSGEKTEFLGQVSDENLLELYRGAKALLYPVEDEDFGMVPVEAMAWGTPVIAHFSGGPKETIIDGKTGIFSQELTVAGFRAAVQKFSAMEWDLAKITRQAHQYSCQAFDQKIQRAVQRLFDQN
jgi:glycosyltransferase involved in cell wall biosynthesis